MSLDHRSDIQGLRGVSVLLVVLYHTDTFFTGGFIGVDVFFVISGYVIMRSLLNEYHDNATISVKRFITRRIYRLLPASTTVVVFTLFASVFIFSPYSEQNQIAITSISSTFFSTNLYFVLQNSYSALVNNPLRHMWSLGVEEQFYVFLIIAISLIIYISKNEKKILSRILFFVTATGLISFVANIVFSAGIRLLPLPTRIAFFSPVTRIWELQIGVVAALVSIKFLRDKKPSITSEFLALFGIILIIFGALKFDSFTSFPGPYALIPTSGGMLVVLFAGQTRFISSLLSLKPLRYLGDISYSWYLWHWPIIVFAQILAPGNRVVLVMSGFLSLIPSVITYHFIENRFRINHQGFTPTPIRLFLSSTGMQLLAALFVILGASTTYGLKLDNLSGATGSWAFKAGCQMTEPIFPTEQCLITRPNTKDTILLIGDSQAGSISDGVKAATDELKINFAVWYNDGCPVFPRPTVERNDCAAFLESLPSLIEKLDPAMILVANKSTLYTTGGAQRGGLTIEKPEGGPPKTYAEAIEMWVRGLQMEFGGPVFSDETIVLVQQVPPSKPVSPTLLNKGTRDYKFDLNSTPDRNKLIAAEYSLLSKMENISFLNPADTLCPKSSCSVTENGQTLYSDEFHLSPTGSLRLKNQIMTMIVERLTSP